jgi:glycosyltransferase involved in cell wall biosynthesis
MRLIPNVIPGDFITGPLVSKPDNTLGLIASNLSDPNKGVGKVLALAERYPEIAFELIGPASKPIEAPPNVKLLGRLPSSEIARRASYWRAGLVVSSYENAPAVISELACLGVPTVSIPSGAIREMSEMYGFGAVVSSGDSIGSLEDALSRLQPFTLFKTRSEIASRARAIHAEARLLNDHLDAYGLL